MQTLLLLQMLGQNTAVLPANGGKSAEGQVAPAGEGAFSELFQVLWQSQGEVAVEAGDDTGLDAGLLVAAGGALGTQSGTDWQGTDLDALLRSLALAAEGEGEGAEIARRLSQQLQEQDLSAEELMQAIEDLLELPEAQTDQDGEQLLLELLAQLPETQRQALEEWAESGNLLPETASRLSALLQDVARSAEPEAAAATGTAADSRSDRSAATESAGGIRLPVAEKRAEASELRQQVAEMESELLPKVLEKGASTDASIEVDKPERAAQRSTDPGGRSPVPASPVAASTTVASPATGTEQTIGPRSATAELSQAFDRLQVSPGNKQWGNALGERVLWMVGNEIQRAELRLNPPRLGPLEIRVAVHNDQASVTFSAPHAVTREALEGAIPRLREMLAENNLNLANVDVGQQDAGESRDRSGPGSGTPAYGGIWSETSGEVEGPLAAAANARHTSGLVDYFA